MNSWVQVNVCVPTRAEQVALTDSRKSGERKDDELKVENGEAASEKGEENMSEQVSFVQIITKFLLDYDLEHKWTEKDEKYLMVEFYCPCSKIDELVDIFDHAGIGKQFNSTYKMIPCLFYQSTRANATINVVNRKSKEDKETSDFLKTMKSRFAVQQVVEGARNAGTINFDYSVFLFCAGLLAATGLVENSSVVLVASMLVSPIMGPILAGTFGMSIQEKSLYRLGIRNEIISLACCLIIGFFYGLVYSNMYMWHNGVFITEEMKSRGQIRSLGIGLLVALPSGVGVALSVLGNNVGSLVGVAISASLLPPMVNAGILFSLSLVKTISGDLSMPGNYTKVYSDEMNVEAACLGAFSICLTLLNIFCIVIMGLLVLKIKQVVPRASNTLLKKFWTEDLPVVREQNARATRPQEHDRGYDHYKTVGLERLFDEIHDDPVYKTVCAVAYRNPHGKLSPSVDLNRQSNMNRHSNPFFAAIPGNRRSYDILQASKVKSHEDFCVENEEEVALRRPTSPPPGSALRKIFKRKDTVGNMHRKSNTRFDVKKIPEETVNLDP